MSEQKIKKLFIPMGYKTSKQQYYNAMELAGFDMDQPYTAYLDLQMVVIIQKEKE